MNESTVNAPMSATGVRSRFLDAMRYMASSVVVLTTDGPQGRAGITVSAACSLSADPPGVLVCIHRAGRSFSAFATHQKLCLNVLSAEQTHVADSFAGRIEKWKDDRFACADWRNEAGQCPELIGALANLQCTVVDRTDFGSHAILVCSVDHVHHVPGSCLLYVDRAYSRVATNECFSRQEMSS